jgi:predicted DsbA family dithiol-disulfide isomerase
MKEWQKHSVFIDLLDDDVCAGCWVVDPIFDQLIVHWQLVLCIFRC